MPTLPVLEELGFVPGISKCGRSQSRSSVSFLEKKKKKPRETLAVGCGAAIRLWTNSGYSGVELSRARVVCMRERTKTRSRGTHRWRR